MAANHSNRVWPDLQWSIPTDWDFTAQAPSAEEEEAYLAELADDLFLADLVDEQDPWEPQPEDFDQPCPIGSEELEAVQDWVVKNRIRKWVEQLAAAFDCRLVPADPVVAESSTN